MKKRVLNKIRKNLIKQYSDYNSDKIDVIMYGVEALYITLEKSIIIFSLSFIFGIFKELILLLIFFNIIRMFAFGMHAPTGFICLIMSSVIFLLSAYLLKILTIPKSIIPCIYMAFIFIEFLFAPADTVKRPIVKKKKRKIFKLLSILVTTTYFIISIIISNKVIINAMLLSILIECLLILPLTYKIFKLPYNNYKNFGSNIN